MAHEPSDKDKILKRIREALVQKTRPYSASPDLEADIYQWPDIDMALLFAEQFKALGGKIMFCENEHELAYTLILVTAKQGWQRVHCVEPALQRMLDAFEFPYTPDINLEGADAAITSCEAMVARFGAIVVTSRQILGRTSTVYPPVHVVIAKLSCLYADIKTALEAVRKSSPAPPSMISVIAGPSRTADIEKTLVMGAHGPKELYLFITPD